VKAIFGMHKGGFGEVNFSELVPNELWRISITCADERWVNPKLSRWKGQLILWVRQRNDDGYFPRKGWGFNLLFLPETDEERKMLYEYQWTYSPGPNLISYLITPNWPDKVEPTETWEKVRDTKLYSSLISNQHVDLKKELQEKTKEAELLEQYQPEQITEGPSAETATRLSGEDVPTHEELQKEFGGEFDD